MRKFIESFNAAVEGFVYVLRNERNMRVHFLTALFFVLLGVYLNFTGPEILILSATITLVLLAEMVNTSIEHIVDLVKPEMHPMAKVIKDMGAGAVLLTAVNAVIAGFVLFSKRIPFNIEEQMLSIRKSPWSVTFIALILVFATSILCKIMFHKGTPLRGGMPSGHSAIAFSIWTLVTFMTNNSIVIMLTFLMAFLIARHRVKDSVHTLLEVIAGAILGILLTTLIFQIFR